MTTKRNHGFVVDIPDFATNRVGWIGWIVARVAFWAAIGVAVGVVANRLAVDAEPNWYSETGIWYHRPLIVVGVSCALLGGLGAWFGFLRSTDPFEWLGAPVFIGASVLCVTWILFVQENPPEKYSTTWEAEIFMFFMLMIVPAVLVLSWPFPLGFLIGRGIRLVTDLTGWEPRPKPDSVALWARPSLTVVWSIHLGVQLSRAWRRVRPSTRFQCGYSLSRSSLSSCGSNIDSISSDEIQHAASFDRPYPAIWAVYRGHICAVMGGLWEAVDI